MSNSTSSPRIVPDADQSVTARHLRHRKQPRLWPLWLLMVAIIVMLGVATAGLWYERERLFSELHRVSGEVSNLHARRDSEDTEAQDTLIFVQAQMATLFQDQEQLAIAVANMRDEFYSLLTVSEKPVSQEAVSSLVQSVEQLREQASLRDGQLAAIRGSLDALEQVGVSGRQNMLEEITLLEQDMIQRIDVLERQLTSESRELETALAGWHEEADQRLAALAASIEALEASQTLTLHQASLNDLTQQWEQRINILESDIRQVRQAQLAVSAQMEMLR